MLSSILSSNPEHYQIAMFLEPHLPLIKSRHLYELYRHLRYNTKPHEELLHILDDEARLDYRLHKVIEQVVSKFSQK